LTRPLSPDLELNKAAHLLSSDPGAAARSASAVLDQLPGHAEASLLLATAMRRLGDPAAAVRALDQIAAAQLESPLMQLELGRAQAAGGNASAACSAFRRAVALDPELAEGWLELASELFRGEDEPGGDVAYARYQKLAGEPPALNDVAAALADNRLATSEALLQRRLKQTPHDGAALRMLAEVATRREDFAQAERLLNECLRHAPGDARARYELAQVLYAQSKAEEVLPLTGRLLRAEADNTHYVSLHAQALRLTGRSEEAVRLMEQHLTAHPGDESAALLFGHLLREVGLQSRAIEEYRGVLRLRPDSGAAYWSLANLKTFRFSADELATLRAQLSSSQLRAPDRIQLEFALGKALEDSREYAGSFEHYARANSLKRATLTYNPDAVTADVRLLKQIFTAEFFAARAAWGSERPDPIFIVGLPRSGSTLLEQVLASHSQVEGTRELPNIPAMVLELIQHAGPVRRPYPGSAGELTPLEIAALASRYLADTQRYRTPGTPRFVDKMLINFSHVGLIHLMFPKATIIDARRHPLGCSFSCYKQLFARGMEYTYDQRDIALYYRDYADLMAHFDTVLPGRIHRVNYESFVANPESGVRLLLEHCHLPFEDECLRFYENRRVVQTISSEQVRQPIFSDSVGLWQHYESWLGPMKEVLGE
jgi:Flp pilus assembly protein TadD